MSIPPKKVAHLGAFQFFDLDRLEENQNQRVASIIYTPLKTNGEPGPLQLLGRFSDRSCMNLLGNSSFNSFCRAFPVCRSPPPTTKCSLSVTFKQMAPPPVRSRMARCTSLLEPPSQAEKMSSTNEVSTVRKWCDESVGRSQKRLKKI